MKKEEDAKAKAEKKGHKDNASKIPGPRKPGKLSPLMCHIAVLSPFV